MPADILAGSGSATPSIPAADMLGASRFETACVRNYLLTAVAPPQKRVSLRQSRALVSWIAEHGCLLGLKRLPIKLDEDDGFKERPRESVRKVIQAVVPQLKKIEAAPSPLEKRLCWIAETLDLDDVDASLLGVCVRTALFLPVHALAGAADDGNQRADGEINVNAMARLIGCTPRAVQDRLRRGRPLIQLGLLEDRIGGDFAPSGTVLRIASLNTRDPKRLCAALFGDSPPATLSWSDFDHLAEARDLAAGIMAAALETVEKGIGILLHGAPGTGKTEFAHTLAKRLKARVIPVGEMDHQNGEPSRADRIAHFILASTLAQAAGRTIMVVDEADDIFTGVDESDRAARIGSKIFMNRLVERCPTPTIWITNQPERLGEAVMRRMSLAIAFPAPGHAVRRRMAERLAEKHMLTFANADLEKLARLPAAPALLEAGLRAAAMTGGAPEAAATCTRSLLLAIGTETASAAQDAPTAFDPRLSAADCDLEDLARRVEAAPEKALSFCFYGLSGTGKSAYARYLARRLGLEIIQKRASDLLSMWVGGTEKAIAEAFASAADARAMLILDEADSLLRDRGLAVRCWEVTQVNEMLTQMERHPFPFVMTTNQMESLDPATLRRFLFKIKFLPMSSDQGVAAFRRAFGSEPPPALADLDLLTPGDFAVVERKAKVLGESDPHRLVSMLVEEVGAKPGARSQAVGFTAKIGT